MAKFKPVLRHKPSFTDVVHPQPRTMQDVLRGLDNGLLLLEGEVEA